jgi:endonuclease G
MIDPSITASTEKRYADSTDQRERLAAAVAAYGPVVAAPPELVAMRIDHLGRGSEITDLERLVGGNDLVSVRFLSSGVTAAATVGRISLDGAIGVPTGFGTGSLVSPRLLLTNHHVLASAEAAATAVVEFGFEEVALAQRRPGETYALDPGALFLTDADLDFTLVAVAPVSAGGRRLEDHGHNRLIEQTGKVLVGEPLNIVQHPDGGPKVVALRENSLLTILDDFLHYRADTNPGSSGAPVYNDQWQLVALHHSGVPRKDAEGRWLTRDGSVWTEAMGEDAVDWIANEGVRISRIIARLKAAPLMGEAAAVREQALTAAPAPTPERPEVTVPAASATATTAQPGPDGAIDLTVPVRIRVHVLGTVPEPRPAPVPAAPVTLPPAAVPEGVLRDALAELARATERPYYDPEADGAISATYYAGLPEDPAAFPGALAELVRASHTTRPHYRPSVELYPWVDLQPDLKLTSVYSGQRFDPATLIADDLLTEATLAYRLASEAGMCPDALEAALPFNCEHVVPQSWFSKDEPQRGDLHHLFTCGSRCNSFRGNIPYNTFDPLEEATMEDCGRRDEIRFEPELGRGAVARATLYMLLRYASQVDWSRSDYVPERLPTLLAWHRDNPVSDYERHRNAAIHERQGNRNPFIDHPDWTERLELSQLVVR